MALAAPDKGPQERGVHEGVVNAMSVDVEDYYQVWALASAAPRDRWEDHPSRVVGNTQKTLDLFARHGVKATFFMLGCVAERHPRLARQIVDEGHELASHGYAHFKVQEQDAKTFLEDVTRTKKILEDHAGQEIKGFRAASFSISEATWWAFDALADAGYHYSSSLHPIKHDHYGMPDAPRSPFQPTTQAITEIPVATAEVFGRRISCAGGGHFRLFPYWWSKSLLRRVNRDNRLPATFYFHPWEIDPDQPVLAPIPLKSRLRHYTNLSVMESKLHRLLSDFSWDRIDRVYAGSLAAKNPA